MIVVPYVEGRLSDETRGWAVRHHAALRLLSEDRRAYWHALVDLWTWGHDLVIVEQDIVPAVFVVEEMLACPHPWCTSPYPRPRPPGDPDPGLLEHGLGCVKFSAALMAEHPQVMAAAGRPAGEDEPRGAWWMLDARLNHVLRGLDLAPHVHRQSKHLHR